MLKFVIIIVLISMAAGCGFTTKGDFLRGAVADAGAKANDEGIRNASWYLCNAVSIGAVRRWLGADLSRVRAYRTLCESTFDTEELIDVAPAAAGADTRAPD